MKKIIITENQLSSLLGNETLQNFLSNLALNSGDAAQQVQTIIDFAEQASKNGVDWKTALMDYLSKIGLNFQHQNMDSEQMGKQEAVPTPNIDLLNLITKHEAGSVLINGKSVPREYGYKMKRSDLYGYAGPEDVAKAKKGLPYHKTYGYGLKFTPDGKHYMDSVNGGVYTQKQLESMFVQSVQNRANKILNFFKANYPNAVIGQNQLNALVSACYQFGENGFLVKRKMGNLIGQNPDNPLIVDAWKKLPYKDRRAEEASIYAKDIQNA